jgi:hypothetical protein
VNTLRWLSTLSLCVVATSQPTFAQQSPAPSALAARAVAVGIADAGAVSPVGTGTTATVGAQQPDHGPRIDYTLVFTATEPQPGIVDPAVLAAITTWLADNFDLPAANRPRVELVPPARIAAFRYRGFAQPQTSGDEQAMHDAGREIAGVYDDATRTIYLPEGWSGATPAELSVLVHEMVHHLQNGAQLKYECPQAREQLAYAAQERWLSRHDRSLASEFEIDPFTLLVRTRCLG